MTEDELRSAAIKRLKDKQDFRTHVVTYVVVNAFLVAIWAITSGGGYFWPAWPMFGWGIGLILHGWAVFGQHEISEADIEREMRRRGGLPAA